MSEPAISQTRLPAVDAGAEVTPPVVIEKVIGSDNDWATTIESLELVGFLKQLAMHCVVKHRQDNTIQLALEPSNEYLYTKERQDRLQEALSTSMGESIRLSIKIEKSQLETPAEQGTRQRQAKQDAAAHAIKTDANVQNIIEAFNATVDEKSIQSLD